MLKNLRSKELTPFAIEAAGRLPGQEVQRNLAAVVLDQGQPEPLRSAAAIELCRHIQTFGRLVTEVQVKNLEEAHAALPESKFRLNVALVLGSLRPDPRVTGERLQRYVPAFGSPAAAKETPDK